MDRTPSAEATYRASFLFDPNGLDTRGGMVDIFRGERQDGGQIFGVQYAWSNDGPMLRAYVEAAGERHATDWRLVSDEAQKIELIWRSAEQASFQFKIADQLAAELAGLDTSASKLETVTLGVFGDLPAGMGGAAYFDAFESDRPIPGDGGSFQLFMPSIITK